jgi:hypothetical protein
MLVIVFGPGTLVTLTLFLLLIWSPCIFGNVPFLAEARACVCESVTGAVIFKCFEKNTHIVKGLPEWPTFIDVYFEF